MTRAVLWDLDGTLIDSEEFHWLAWKQTMDAEGIAITRAYFEATFGQRNDAILPHWLGAKATSESIARIGGAKEACYRRLVHQSGVVTLPGAAEWVKTLRAQGWAQAIASSAPRLNVEAVVEVLDFGDCFQALAASEDVHRGKPDPEVYLVAASRVGAAPERSIVVEDAPAGLEGARRGGMRSIGVSRNGAELQADLVVRSLADLAPDAFEKLLAGRYI